MTRARRLIFLQYDGPHGLTLWSIRIFLFRFLSHKRIVDLPKIFWWPLLLFIIIPLRSHKSFRAYARVFDGKLFNMKKNTLEFFSEFKKGSEIPAELLFLGNGNKVAKERIKELQSLEEDWTIVPLYPQYSTASWGYLLDHFNKVALKTAATKNIISPYYREFAKLAAKHILSSKVLQDAEVLLISFHSLPIKRVLAGDTYEKECQETFSIIKEKLNELPLLTMMVYQSRFKSEGEWLSPFTSEVLKDLSSKKIKNVAIFPASFLFDCVETTYELGDELAEEAAELGISLRLIPLTVGDELFCEMKTEHKNE